MPVNCKTVREAMMLDVVEAISVRQIVMQHIEECEFCRVWLGLQRCEGNLNDTFDDVVIEALQELEDK